MEKNLQGHQHCGRATTSSSRKNTSSTTTLSRETSTDRFSLTSHEEDPSKHNWLTTLGMPLAGFGSFCKMNFQKLKQTFGTAKNQHPFLEYKMHLEMVGAPPQEVSAIGGVGSCSASWNYNSTPKAVGGGTTSHAVDTTTPPEQDYVLGTNFWRNYRLRQHTASNSSASSSSTAGFILQRGLSSESNPNEEHEDQMTLQEMFQLEELPCMKSETIFLERQESVDDGTVTIASRATSRTRASVKSTSNLPCGSTTISNSNTSSPDLLEQNTNSSGSDVFASPLPDLTDVDVVASSPDLSGAGKFANSDPVIGDEADASATGPCSSGGVSATSAAHGQTHDPHLLWDLVGEGLQLQAEEKAMSVSSQLREVDHSVPSAGDEDKLVSTTSVSSTIPPEEVFQDSTASGEQMKKDESKVERSSSSTAQLPLDSRTDLGLPSGRGHAAAAKRRHKTAAEIRRSLPRYYLYAGHFNNNAASNTPSSASARNDRSSSSRNRRDWNSSIPEEREAILSQQDNNYGEVGLKTPSSSSSRGHRLVLPGAAAPKQAVPPAPLSPYDKLKNRIKRQISGESDTSNDRSVNLNWESTPNCGASGGGTNSSNAEGLMSSFDQEFRCFRMQWECPYNHARAHRKSASPAEEEDLNCCDATLDEEDEDGSPGGEGGRFGRSNMIKGKLTPKSCRNSTRTQSTPQFGANIKQSQSHPGGSSKFGTSNSSSSSSRHSNHCTSYTQHPHDWIATQSVKMQKQLKKIRESGWAPVTPNCDCVRCCLALLDKCRDPTRFAHNYAYSYFLWGLQFGTKSFFLNRDIVPTIRFLGDIKMPTLIVPFRKTSRARFSLPVREPDEVLMEYYDITEEKEPDLLKRKKMLKRMIFKNCSLTQKSERTSSGSTSSSRRGGDHINYIQKEVNKGKEAGFKEIKADWLWPNKLTPHLNSKNFDAELKEEEGGNSSDEDEATLVEQQDQQQQHQVVNQSQNKSSSSTTSTSCTPKSCKNANFCSSNNNSVDLVSGGTTTQSGCTAGSSSSSSSSSTTGINTSHNKPRWHHRYRSKKPSHVITSDSKFLAAIRNPKQKVIYFIHGGGYVVCSTQTHRGLVYNLVDKTGFLLFTPNYRRPPDVDIVVTIDDCLQGYLHLVHVLKIAPSRINLFGDSAGAGLCLQLLQILKGRLHGGRLSCGVGNVAGLARSRRRSRIVDGTTTSEASGQSRTGPPDEMATVAPSCEDQQHAEVDHPEILSHTPSSTISATTARTCRAASCMQEASFSELSHDIKSSSVTASDEQEREKEDTTRLLQPASSSPPPGSLMPPRAVLISPWVDFTSSEQSDASFVTNRKLDIFRPEGVKRFANIVASGSLTVDKLSSPLVSPTYYYKNTDSPPAKENENENNFSFPETEILVTAGEHELFRDQIVDLVDKLQSIEENQIEFEIFQDMCHVFEIFFPIHSTPKRAFASIAEFYLRNNENKHAVD
ncbi:unnamed protein product [Amoebophrya sp. A120]|nr:unnamed protein product [Amoebophrya sp. A120]|eukprot:GSA120T00007158001.1